MSLVSTGVEGLDEILGGGLPPARLYLVQGNPGSGKTTLGLHFLLEGLRRGERGLYVSLSETRAELRGVAGSHGWNIDKLPVFDLLSDDRHLTTAEQTTLFEPSEVELAEVTRALLEQVDEVKPQRVVFDSLSEMRLLAQSALRYRRQLLALKQHFADRDTTVMLMDDRTSEAGDLQLQSLAHGVIEMEQLAPLYGSERRRVRVSKLRGVGYRGGYHDFRIVRGGLVVYPRLVAADHRTPFTPEQISSGLPNLDALVGGGFDRGTSALMIGPAGSGKSALAMQYAAAAAQRGENSAAYLFDEGLGTLFTRGEALGIPLRQLVEQGKLTTRQIDPAEMSPGEFICTLRDDVVKRDAKVVVIDSLNGYLAAMPEEKFLIIQMHELINWLRQRGVLCILVVAQAGMIGPMSAPVDLSYLADTVVLLRFYEYGGELRKAISVIKRRSGAHLRHIRELTMGPGGVKVGDQLKDLHGVLTGVPHPAETP